MNCLAAGLWREERVFFLFFPAWWSPLPPALACYPGRETAYGTRKFLLSSYWSKMAHSLWARRYLNLTLISHFVGFLAIPSLCVFGCNSCQQCFISWLFLAQLLFFLLLQATQNLFLGSSSCRWASTWILKVSRMAPLPGPLWFKRTHAFSAQADSGGSEQSQTGNSSAQNTQHSPAYLAWLPDFLSTVRRISVLASN